MRTWSERATFGISVLASVAVLAVSLDALGQETDESSREADDMRASPEVQSQVGMGTEKEEPEPDPGATETAPPPPPPPPVDAGEAPTYGHGWQFGLRAGLALGYKVLIRFDDSPPCDGDGDQKVCGHSTPPALDLALSYGVLDSIEPYIWMRIGLDETIKTQTEATSLIGAGVRIYTTSDSQIKLFFEPGLALELEGGTSAAQPWANYSTDYLVHAHFGLQYDFLRHLGLYASAGPNVTFVRAIGTEFEGSIGLQGRAP